MVRGLQSSVETVQESMGSAMAGVAVNMERSMAMMDTMNNVMEQYLTESVRTGPGCASNLCPAAANECQPTLSLRAPNVVRTELVACFSHGRRGLKFRIRNSCRFAIDGIAVTLKPSEGLEVTPHLLAAFFCQYVNRASMCVITVFVCPV